MEQAQAMKHLRLVCSDFEYQVPSNCYWAEPFKQTKVESGENQLRVVYFLHDLLKAVRHTHNLDLPVLRHWPYYHNTLCI